MTQENTSNTGSGRWQFWVDRGGTFTDVVGKRPDGSLVTYKLLRCYVYFDITISFSGGWSDRPAWQGCSVFLYSSNLILQAYFN